MKNLRKKTRGRKGPRKTLQKSTQKENGIGYYWPVNPVLETLFGMFFEEVLCSRYFTVALL